MAEYIANRSGTAYVQCPPASIHSRDEFYRASPYAPGGPLASARVFASQLGNVQETAGVRKPYYGNRPYIVDRIAYNACQTDPEQRVWQKYGEVTSGAEAYAAAEHWFHGRAALPYVTDKIASVYRSGRDIGAPPDNAAIARQVGLFETAAGSRAGADQMQPAQAITIDDVDAHRLDQLKRVIPLPGTTRTEGKEAIGPRRESGEERERTEIKQQAAASFVPYPHATVYARCPPRAVPPAADVSRRWQEFKGVQEAQLHKSLQDKTIYCGRQLEDLIKAQMCNGDGAGDLSALMEGLDMSAIQLGSPSQCFQFGKYAKTPMGASSYFNYLADD